ncbi:MAG: vWA domain-containing protein [Planctomycetota bacterium]
MGLTFAEPWWLALSLLAVPLGLLGLRWFSAMTRWRAWSAVIARSLLLLALAAALARASMVRSSDDLAVVAVADISDSIARLASVDGEPASPAIRDWVVSATETRGSDDLFGLVVFDDGAIAVNTPRAASTTDVSLDYTVSPEGTNIAEALRFARALYPPGAGRRMLLISDGNETSGDALQAARELAGEGIRVDVLPISYRVEREVMIEAVDVPPQAAEESTVTVRVVLSSTQRTTGTLEVLYEGDPLDLAPEATRTGRRITLEPGRNVETIEVPLTANLNVHRFEPVFVPDNAEDDRIASNNRAESFTVTPGRGRVLIVDGVSDALANGQGRLLERTLAQANIDATTIAPAEFPSDPLEFQTASLIVLQNVAKEELTLRSQELLADYVQDLAGGLVMIGGPDSFGAGGWNGSPIEPLLPVLLDLPEQLIIPSAAVVMVLDSSGSMGAPVLGGSRSQQQIANEAAALAIQTLDQGDLIGVIEFNSGFDEVVPLQKAENPALLADRVRDISPGGGTNLYPALRQAGALLDSVEANVKHIIVLSDGQS